MVWIAAALAWGAVAVFECVPTAVASEEAEGVAFLLEERFQRGGDEARECFIMSRPSEDPLEETQEAFSDLRNGPALWEATLCVSKGFAFRRFLREKRAEAVAADQKISVLTGVLSHIIPKLEVNSPLISLFSIQVAVRK
jgi:hypothetical protein